MAPQRSAQPAVSSGSSLLYDVFLLSRAVDELLAADLAGAPLTAYEYAVYSHIYESRATTPTTMARALGVPATTVSDWLRAMTSRGHVTRSPSEIDRRSFELRLTTDGRRAHRATNRRFERAYARFLTNLPVPPEEVHDTLVAAITAARAATQRSSGQNVSAGT